MSARDFDVLWALSIGKQQAAYGTPLDDADLTAALPFNGPDLADFQLALQSDREEFGRGHEWPTASEIERKDLRLKRAFDLSPETLGLIAALGLGNVVSANESASAYKHTIKPLAPASAVTLPVTTVVEMLNSGVKRKLQDLAVADFSISAEGANGRLKLEANFIGSGTIAANSMTMPSSLSAVNFLRLGDVAFSLGGSTISARLKRLNFAWNNNPMADDGYYPSTGKVRGRMEYGNRREAKLTFTLRHSGDATDHDRLANKTELAVIVTVDGGAAIVAGYNYKFVLTVPKLVFTKLTPTIVDGIQCYDIETELRYDSSTGAPFKLEVWNAQAAYLAT